jgi:hypothetical protein
MRLHRTVSTVISRQGDGLSVHAAINAQIAANVDESESDAQAPRPGRDVTDEQEIKEVPDE